MLQNTRVDIIVLGISLFITFVVFGAFYSYVLIEKENEFDLIKKDLEDMIKNRLVNYEQVLISSQGLFVSSDQVTEDEWRHFIQNQQVTNRFPGVQIVAYSQKIGNSDDLAKHIQQVRIKHPDYNVRPNATRDEYHSIVYIEPVNTRNLQAFGYDMFSEPIRELLWNKLVILEL